MSQLVNKATRAPIVGVYERLFAIALIDGVDSHGDPIYRGESDVDWDSQRPVLRNGRPVYVDVTGALTADVEMLPEDDAAPESV